VKEKREGRDDGGKDSPGKKGNLPQACPTHRQVRYPLLPIAAGVWGMAYYGESIMPDMDASRLSMRDLRSWKFSSLASLISLEAFLKPSWEISAC